MHKDERKKIQEFKNNNSVEDIKQQTEQKNQATEEVNIKHDDEQKIKKLAIRKLREHKKEDICETETPKEMNSIVVESIQQRRKRLRTKENEAEEDEKERERQRKKEVRAQRQKELQEKRKRAVEERQRAQEEKKKKRLETETTQTVDAGKGKHSHADEKESDQDSVSNIKQPTSQRINKKINVENLETHNSAESNNSNKNKSQPLKEEVKPIEGNEEIVIGSSKTMKHNTAKDATETDTNNKGIELMGTNQQNAKLTSETSQSNQISSFWQIFNLKNYFGKKPTTVLEPQRQLPSQSLSSAQPQLQPQPQLPPQSQRRAEQLSNCHEDKREDENVQQQLSSVTPPLLSHPSPLAAGNDNISISEFVDSDSSFSSVTFFPQSPSRPLATSYPQLTEVGSSSPFLSDSITSNLDGENISSTIGDKHEPFSDLTSAVATSNSATETQLSTLTSAERDRILMPPPLTAPNRILPVNKKQAMDAHNYIAVHLSPNGSNSSQQNSRRSPKLRFGVIKSSQDTNIHSIVPNSTVHSGLPSKENDMNCCSTQKMSEKQQTFREQPSIVQNDSNNRTFSSSEKCLTVKTPSPKKTRPSLQAWMNSPEFQVEIPLDPPDDDDSEPNPARKIPSWCLQENLRKALLEQAKIDPDEIFQNAGLNNCDLNEIFGNNTHSRRRRQRTSSGNWTKDRLLAIEEEQYKIAMGFIKK
jgi:hypothetical protein